MRYPAVLAGLTIMAAAWGAEYHVDPVKGNDAASGALEAPWQHLSVCASKVQPGDTVYLRGGTYRADSLFTTTDGLPDQPVTITAFPGETPILTGEGIWGQVMHLNNDYYVVDGLTFEDTSTGNVLFMNLSEHVQVRNCRFRRSAGTMILLRGGGQHVVRDCDFDTTGSPTGGGDGDHIYITGSSYNLVERNHFVRAGHAVCDIIEYGEFRAHHNIIRDNTIEQHWGGGLYVSRGSYRNLFERNRIAFAGEEMEYPKAPVQVAADNNIVRHNLMLASGSNPYRHNGLLLAGYRYGGIDQHCRNNGVYHNVLYRIGRTPVAVTQRQACQVTGNEVLNNIVYRCRTGGPAEEYWPAGNYYLTFETYHAFADNKWQRFPNGNRFDHNLFLHADEAGDHPGEERLAYYEPEGWAHSLAWLQTSFADCFHHNLERNPGFVDAEAGDFRLKPGSPAVDAGDYLTRTTAAGVKTTIVKVRNAGPFCDGWGLVTGDLVQVGRNRPATLLAADYERNELRVDRPLTFDARAPVSLPWTGAAPDLGAYEADTK